MSDRGSYSSGTGCGLGGKLGSQSLGETSDFTLIALQKTLFSYFTRLLGLLLILVLNGFSAGFSAVLDFTLSHITASIFAVLLVIVSLFRVRYPYEFSFNRLFFKSKSLLTTPLFNLFTRAARFVAVPFKTVAEFLGILIRFLSIARAQSPRKAKESAEVYHERLVKEHQIMTNVIGFFKVDRIRRVLSRFGLLRSRGSRTGFQGHDKSILEVIFPKSLRRIGMSAYKERFSLRSRLAMLIQKRFNLSRLIEERVVTHRRLRSPSLLRYIRAGPTAVRKRKIVYFSFEPTEEFLRFKNSVMVTVNFVKVQTLRAMEFVKQRQDLRKDLPVKRHRREKELKRSFRKVVSSTMRVSRNTVSYVKWKLTEWINKQ